MDCRIDLTRYENLYDNFDGGHNRTHLEEVRSYAIELGKKYAPDKLELIWVAATLHDIGLSIERENHESHGAKIIENDSEITSSFNQQEISEILEAIREHRASDGNPDGIVAKIVSDSDKVSSDANRAFKRAYEWGKKNLPQVDHYGQLLRAAYHLHEKFGVNGTGTRVYFEETKEEQQKVFQPIFEALEKYDLNKMEDFLR